MDPGEWVRFVGKEYLAAYVRDGGAAVKFAAASTESGRAEVRRQLADAAEAYGFQLASLDATEVKLHFVERLFHAVAARNVPTRTGVQAAQVDWDALARAYIERLLRARGLRLPNAPAPLSVSRIAELNAAPEMMLRNDLRGALAQELFEDYAMTREFRLAMFSLCAAQLDPTDNPVLEASIKTWLRGELRLISEVKRALIFQKIARHNARHMLFSLAHWLTLTGKNGLLLVLDIARYADAARPAQRGPGNYYSTAATMDMYEVLRELIDATDEAHACFVGVLVGTRVAVGGFGWAKLFCTGSPLSG